MGSVNKCFSPKSLFWSTFFGIIIFDQWLKVYIKTNFLLGEEIFLIGDWFRLHFLENPGMALGIQFGGDIGKVLLSLFRVIVSIFLFRIVFRQFKQGHVRVLFIIPVALILGGAVGNIIDSVFYGVLFSGSTPYTVATWLPEEGGYAHLLFGKVVDMFYFPLIRGHFPDFLPFWGGEEFLFFRPVFNLADAAVSVGVVLFLLFNRMDTLQWRKTKEN